jgi:hypothetical protein
LVDFFLQKYSPLAQAKTLTTSNTGRIDDDLLISIMSSSSSCKRAVARPRASSKPEDAPIKQYPLSKASLTTSRVSIFFVPARGWKITDTHLPVSAPMHVGVRSTWLNSEDFSFEKYFQKYF